MIIEVMNRIQASRESFKKIQLPTAIISIIDPKAKENIFANNPSIKFIKTFEFDDEDVGHPNCISIDQAREIGDFVRLVTPQVERIIVHCEAGISRSAGVAAAIMKFLNGDDMEIFSNPKFCPNMTCYTMVLMELMGFVDSRECSDKVAINREAFREKFFADLDLKMWQ